MVLPCARDPAALGFPYRPAARVANRTRLDGDPRGRDRRRLDGDQPRDDEALRLFARSQLLWVRGLGVGELPPGDLARAVRLLGLDLRATHDRARRDGEYP